MKSIYEINDKVRIIQSTDFPDMVGCICDVVGLMGTFSSFACRVKYPPKKWESLMYDWEIEKVPRLKVGQQLLFGFISQ